MARRIFTEEQVRRMAENPHTLHVSTTQIKFTKAFKEEFWQRYQEGDTERGSVWRAVELPWSIRKVEGLTVSAYGEGAKPAFYGSEENGTGGEKWELFSSDETRKKFGRILAN